jgi:hypothetical protein
MVSRVLIEGGAEEETIAVDEISPAVREPSPRALGESESVLYYVLATRQAKCKIALCEICSLG